MCWTSARGLVAVPFGSSGMVYRDIGCTFAHPDEIQWELLRAEVPLLWRKKHTRRSFDSYLRWIRFRRRLVRWGVTRFRVHASSFPKVFLQGREDLLDHAADLVWCAIHKAERRVVTP